MLMISQRFEGTRPADAPPADARLVIPFDTRSRSRFRGCLETGEDVGVVLARGQVLRGGDLLVAADGRVIEIAAAPETVTTARSADARLLARAAYHLGNRHVALQVGSGWLRYGHDHVLDEMVAGLGLALIVEDAPFEPEGGAYGGAEGGHMLLANGHGHAHRGAAPGGILDLRAAAAVHSPDAGGRDVGVPPDGSSREDIPAQDAAKLQGG